MWHNSKPVAVILAVVVAMIGVSAVRSAAERKEVIPWRGDFPTAKREAESSHKPVFAYFTASWCGPCQSLKHTTWADPAVEAALRDYVPVKIDIDEHRDLAEQYSIEAVPGFLVMDSAGKVLKSAVGALPPKEFLNWLKG